MKKIRLVIMLIALAGCSNELELQKIKFVPDPEFPGLPIYSEWGYNTFGAYYERAPFTSAHRGVPAKFIVNSGHGTFMLEGQYPGSYSYGSQLGLRFLLKNMSAEKYEDLVNLHQTTYDLTGSDAEVLVVIDGADFAAPVLEGQLQFIRAQYLRVDGKPMQVILSGRFEFKAIVNGEPVAVQHGRFDVGIMKDNFFKY